ncbi:MAG: hypothetical protein QOG59_2273 [Solirubrobacteraceae bacterium]|nr:hypothetical protein [Solirubrobacteraceae bacterium]
MLTPNGRESATSVLGRMCVRRPDSTCAIADQLIPAWKARASLLQPRRSRAARTREPIAPPSLMLIGVYIPGIRDDTIVCVK